MASLYKDHDSYVLQFYDANRSPSRKRLFVEVNRKRDAERIADRLTAAYEHGKFDPWTDNPRTFRSHERRTLHLEEAGERFLERKAAQGRTKNTLRAYRGNLRRLLKTVGDRPLDTLTAGLLNQYIRADSVSDTTQHKRYRHISAVLNWCVKREYLEENPLDKETAPRRRQKLPKTMYREDLEAICSEVRTDYRTKRQNGDCKKDEVIWRERAFRFAFVTGLRGGELSRLKWKHIDRDRGLIYILRQKNGLEQTIPLHTKAAAVLDEIQEGESDSYVFGGPGTRNGERNEDAFRNNLSRAFRGYKKAAGIDRPISFHSLRHGFCTALAEAGKSAATIKELARHASIETSMIYVKMSNEHLKREVEGVF